MKRKLKKFKSGGIELTIASFDGAIVHFDYERKFPLGDRLEMPDGRKYKYGKIDFGVLCKDTKTGKKNRHICYGWIRIVI